VKQSREKFVALAAGAPGSRPAVAEDDGSGFRPAARELARENTAPTCENTEAARADRYRAVFLSRLAHELRTPLTAILGFAEILLNQEQLTEAQRNFCERIQNSAQQLRQGLNQLSELSRMDAGRREIHAEEFSLQDLLPQSCAAISRTMQRQKSELSWFAAPDLPMIVSDRGMLRQVIESFLDFMTNRNSEGAVVKASAEKNARGFVIKLEDDGELLIDPGSVGVLDLIEQQCTTNFDLGLVIARHHIDLLGGTLSIKNRQPRGLDIVLEFPSVLPDPQTD